MSQHSISMDKKQELQLSKGRKATINGDLLSEIGRTVARLARDLDYTRSQTAVRVSSCIACAILRYPLAIVFHTLVRVTRLIRGHDLSLASK